MNNIAILNHLFMYFLQRQNIKRDLYKKKNLEISPDENKNIVENNDTTENTENN